MMVTTTSVHICEAVMAKMRTPFNPCKDTYAVNADASMRTPLGKTSEQKHRGLLRMSKGHNDCDCEAQHGHDCDSDSDKGDGWIYDLFLFIGKRIVSVT